MEKATILLENDLGVKLDIEKNPLSVVAYDFDGNVISGGGLDISFCTVTFVNNSGAVRAVSLYPACESGTVKTQGFTLLQAGETKVLTGLYEDVSGDGICQVYALTGSETPAALTASNAVNCVYDGTDNTYRTITISEAGESSITLTLTA